MKTTREILRGGLAGAVGTLVMTLVIATSRALDLFWILPPKEISVSIPGQKTTHLVAWRP